MTLIQVIQVQERVTLSTWSSKWFFDKAVHVYERGWTPNEASFQPEIALHRANLLITKMSELIRMIYIYICIIFNHHNLHKHQHVWC